MQFEDEKDYIMRIIKEMVRVLFSLMLGKPYKQVELPPESKYGVSGDRISKWKDMIDSGRINEAENRLLEEIDYQSREDLAEALFFYEYAAEKGDEFLEKCNYSSEEVLDGLKQLAERSGYKSVMDMIL